MVYNFNLGIDWASSGVEYAQSYRGNIFRKNGIAAKFVFVDMFPGENIEHLTKNIGFLDSEIIWLYTFFTNTKIAPVSYSLEDIEKTLQGRKYDILRQGNIVKIVFDGDKSFYTLYMVNDKSNLVHRIEIVSEGCLIRKDYFTYCRIYSEYYAPLDKKAQLYARRFFNEDGSTEYEEIIDDDSVIYRFVDRVLYSKEELVGYMLERLKLSASDTVIVDRTTGIGQAIFMNAGEAEIGVVIHADHFYERATDRDNILWNNHYEYAFSQARRVSFFVCSTDEQNRLLRKHFNHYVGYEPRVVTIPVGSLDELRYEKKPRRRHSLITASRLATQKHVDWIIEAVLKARKLIPDITLDIYGRGEEEEKLSRLIEKHKLENCVRLLGQHKLEYIYVNYEAYVCASQGEGFGLTLMEALGSGLSVIGFDARYGNQTLIKDEKNGYRILINSEMDSKEKIAKLTDAIVKLFTEADIEAYRRQSYELASKYLTSEVEMKWVKLLKKEK